MTAKAAKYFSLQMFEHQNRDLQSIVVSGASPAAGLTSGTRPPISVVMSRLDSFIRRLEAQRLILGWAADSIAGRNGLVLELGLGNGRTFDHLREILPGRRIVAFDREAKANPRSLPAPENLVLGDMAQTLPAFAASHGRCAVLLHVDATTGVPERDAVALVWLPGHVAALAADDALIVAGSPLGHEALAAVALPDGVPEGRYHAYRRRPAGA